MKLQDMHSQVKAELAHIPHWPDPQSDLRMLYNTKRMHSLGRKAENKGAPSQILAESIEQLKGDYPNYEFKYDHEFFPEANKEST